MDSLSAWIALRMDSLSAWITLRMDSPSAVRTEALGGEGVGRSSPANTDYAVVDSSVQTLLIIFKRFVIHAAICLLVYWPDLAGHQSSKRATVDTALELCTEILPGLCTET